MQNVLKHCCLETQKTKSARAKLFLHVENNGPNQNMVCFNVLQKQLFRRAQKSFKNVFFHFSLRLLLSSPRKTNHGLPAILWDLPQWRQNSIAVSAENDQLYPTFIGIRQNVQKRSKS